MQACAHAGLHAPNRSRNCELLSGVCIAALAIAFMIPAARAADFGASNETELYQAIADAQASADATSTIRLTGSFAITAAPPSIAGKAITIETGANALTLSSGQAFDLGSGATLTLSGNILGSGVLNTGILRQDGGGQLVFDGATGSGITRLDLNGGQTLVTGGSEITFANTNAAVGQMQLAGDGETAGLTVSGQGSRLVATGTSFLDIGAGSGSHAAITIEDGGYFGSENAGMRFFGTSTSLTNAVVNLLVTGQGSTLSGSSFFSGNGTGYYSVRDGGQIKVSSLRLGTAGGSVTYANGWSTVEVIGNGSRWDSTGILELSRGTLSILDGGVMTGTDVTLARPSRGATEFSALVSGAGSELRGDTIAVGTGGKGVLTIADKGMVVVGGGAAPLVVGGTNAASDATLNIGGAAGAAAAGAGSLQASAVTLASSGVINFNHTEADYRFDLPINGGGSINQVAGRTIFNADQTGFTGLTSLYGGVLSVNGALGGTMDVVGGRLQGIGTLGNTTNQTGGVIAPGNSIGTLTINGNYIGNGGLLEIETALGGDASPSDRLVVIGDTAGSTRVKVLNQAGAGALTVNGIKVVDVGGVSNGAFALQGDYVFQGQQAVVAGAYAYTLQKNGVATPSDGDWYLRSSYVPPTSPGTPPSNPPASGLQLPLYQPGVPIYEAYGQVLQNLNGLQTLRQRVGERFDGQADTSSSVNGRAIWARIDGAHRRVTPGFSTSGTGYEIDSWRLQAGADGQVLANDAGTLVGGFTLHHGEALADIASVFGRGKIDTRGTGFGGTLTWYGQSGFYADAQAQANWFDSDLSSTTVGRQLAKGKDGFGYALGLELGQRLTLTGGWSLTPQAQLIYSHVDADSFLDPFGARVALSDGDSLRGRLGLSADYRRSWRDGAGQLVNASLYGIANLHYEFLDGTTATVAGTPFTSREERLWGGLGLGAKYEWDRYALYGEVEAQTSLAHFADSHGITGRAGLRVSW